MNKLLSILLQKSDPSFPWGFEVVGGKDKSTPLTIDVVKSGTLASQYLQPGDRVLQINETDSALLTEQEATQLILKPTKCLELLILKFAPPSGTETTSKNNQFHRVSKPPKYQNPRSSHVFEDIREETCTSDTSFRSEKQLSQSNNLQKESHQTYNSNQSAAFPPDQQFKNSRVAHCPDTASTKFQNIESRQSSYEAQSKQCYYGQESQFQNTRVPQQIPAVPQRQFYASDKNVRDERVSCGNSQTCNSTSKSEQFAYSAQASASNFEKSTSNYTAQSNVPVHYETPASAPWRNSHKQVGSNTQQQRVNSQVTSESQNHNNVINAPKTFSCPENTTVGAQQPFTDRSRNEGVRPQFSGTNSDSTLVQYSNVNVSSQKSVNVSKDSMETRGFSVDSPDNVRTQYATQNSGVSRHSVPDLRSFLPKSAYPKLKQPKDFQPKLSNYYENFRLRNAEPRLQRSVSEPSGSQAPSLSSTPDGGAMHPEPVPLRNESRVPLRDRITDPYYQLFNEKRRTFHEGEMNESSFTPLRKSFFRSSNPQLNEEIKDDDRSWRASSYCEGTEVNVLKTETSSTQHSKTQNKVTFQNSKNLAQSKPSNYVRCNSSIPFFRENSSASADAKQQTDQQDNFYYTTTTTNFKPRVFPFPVEPNVDSNKNTSNVRVDQIQEENETKEPSRKDCFSPYDNLSESHTENSVEVKKTANSEEVHQQTREAKSFNRNTQRWEYSGDAGNSDPAKINRATDGNEFHQERIANESFVNSGYSCNSTKTKYETEQSAYQKIEKECISSNHNKSSINEFSEVKHKSNQVVLNNCNVDSTVLKTDDNKLHSTLREYILEDDQEKLREKNLAKDSLDKGKIQSTDFDVYINHFDSSVNSTDYSKYQTKLNTQSVEKNNSVQVSSVKSQSQSILNDDQVCFNEIKYNLSKLCDDGDKCPTAGDKIQGIKEINSERVCVNREAEMVHQNFKNSNLQQEQSLRHFGENETRFSVQSQGERSKLSEHHSESHAMEESIAKKSVYKENQFYENFMTADQHDITRHFQHVFSNGSKTFIEGAKNASNEQMAQTSPESTVQSRPVKTVHSSPEKPSGTSPEKTVNVSPEKRVQSNPEPKIPPHPKNLPQPVKPAVNETKTNMEPAPWRRQSQQIAGSNTPSYSIHADTVDGAPPPPPPPLTAGAIPAVRLKSEIPERGKEPPAAIQNAMMTKDKKPFTYTPGGLDLSEIRSPRMARRITRNQLNPEIAHLPPTPQETQQSSPRQPLPPAALAAMQPAMPVSVFPQQQIPITKYGGDRSSKVNPSSAPPPPAPPAPPPMGQESRYKAPVSNGVINGQRPATLSSENSTNQSRVNQAPGSLYIPPIAKQESGSPQTPPWMQRQNSIPKEVPVWVHRDTVQSPTFSQQQPRIVSTQLENTSSNQDGTRIIPIKIETSQPQHYNQNSSPLSPQNQMNHHQQQNQQYQQPSQQYQQPSQQYQQYQQPSQQYQTQNQSYQQAQPQQQQQQQQRWPVYVPNKFSQPQSPTNENGGPIQSRSFKVLQKITDTDNNEGVRQDYPDASSYNTAGVPLSQLRKMQLSDDDKALMDKVKSQVDDDIFLHSEPDPRYRGAAIPSKAFRMLQSMTSGTTSYQFGVPKTSDGEVYSQNSPVRSATPKYEENGQSRQFVPASQQEHVQEPRKYTGGTIPSRSFRMLQAMTVHNPERPGESEY